MNEIKTMLKKHYNIDITKVSPQQGGWSALAYKVSNNKHAYFLKVYETSRASTPKWTDLIDQYGPIMVWLLHHTKLKGKMPVPVLTNTSEYKCEDDRGIYLLYKYIDGMTIGNRNLTEEQVAQLSEIIAELHLYREEIPVETKAIKEDFDVSFLQQLWNILYKQQTSIPTEVRKLIKPHIEHIDDLIETVEEQAMRLKNSHLKMALCHTDLHNWNLMQSKQQLILIDWEGLTLAPVEADMMFLVDKPYYDSFLRVYRKVHQNFVINPDALGFYQGRRKLEDIWELIEQLTYDNQDSQGKMETMHYLTQALKDLTD
ncbi:aminoglycoside phosphotransferase family protein [Kroppenstedtia pulmonis]|uniref:Aminoglycoside phosphotransferase family protein n=1 Tax=Kroppenstedtia pulmonis TaxID=1380685 RepID=A0A7D3Y330_9BACL|nr:aminoglycoside phosphotransferase family protein [Kroppenstedtia pulmonis]QKG83305.1 aminoglycoside phosphotransferase family protein [Kroppenstedtia pulmonis]